MYRISQVAEILNVSTAIVRSVLIEFHEEMLPFTIVEHGISMVRETGVKVLEEIIKGGSAVRENTNTQNHDSTVLSQTSFSVNDDSTDFKEQLLTCKRVINEKKNELHRLTMDCRKLDETIEHYLEVLKEDMNERIRIEDLLDGDSRDIQDAGDNKHQVVMFDK